MGKKYPPGGTILLSATSILATRQAVIVIGIYVNSERQMSHYLLLASPVNTCVTRHDDVP